MGLNFEFATSSKIIFGNGSAAKVPEITAGLGTCVLFVTGNDSSRARQLAERFSPGLRTSFFSVPDEPTVAMIGEGIRVARRNKCDVIVAMGGGSAIDAGKAIAALAPNRGEITDYLEVIGAGRPLTEKPLPVVAVPTTAGTGAEVTKNAVIKSEEHHVKVSLRSDWMYPRYAIVDPELMLSMPPRLTAVSGMDALSHLLETFVSCQSNGFIDLFCREGMKKIADSLERAFEYGNDREARNDMALASLLGGMALASVKLGAVHGFAGPVGGMFPAPHGAVCARFLPAVMKMNVSAMNERNLSLHKFDEIAQILTGDKTARAADGIRRVEEMVSHLQIPELSEFGIEHKYFPELVQKAKNASSMKGNPVELSDAQLMWILENTVK